MFTNNMMTFYICCVLLPCELDWFILCPAWSCWWWCWYGPPDNGLLWANGGWWGLYLGGGTLVYLDPPLVPILPSLLDWLLELPVETLLPLELVMCPLEVGEWSGEADGGELTDTMYGEMGFEPLLPPFWGMPFPPFLPLGIDDFFGLGVCGSTATGW